ncbi:MAG: DUF4294 domain-containing protein [Bacteroidales bacterium]|nr:DUF4294 domain-containing protein [Bacteroidales bacterium]
MTTSSDRIKRIIVIVVVAILSTVATSAQSRYIAHAIVVGDDTIPVVRLGEVRVFAKKKFKTQRQQRKWTRLIYNVRRALPYARKLSAEFKIINDSLALMTDAKERKAYLDMKEKTLFKKYENDLKHLTVTQGRILVKLIDRETGSTSYEIIKLLKGGFKAFWWQGIARVFGSNLKSEYDAVGTDAEIENIVLLIDLGYY